MKFAVSTYSFGKYREWGIDGLIAKAREMGFDGIDLLEQDIPTVEEARRIRALAEETGIEIVNVCAGADFINKDTDAEIARLKNLADIVEALGARMMRHDITAGDKSGAKVGISYDAMLPKMAAAAREVTEYAEAKGIRTMTENHGFFSQDADRVEKLINAVGHQNFGALVDMGNFMCADEDPWKSVAIMAPYAFHVHVKDFFKKSGLEPNPGKGWFETRCGDYLRGTIIGHGDARVAQSLHVLKKSGYDGYISIEFEGIEDNLLGIELGLANLKKFWEMA